jgi:hypothetical protein
LTTENKHFPKDGVKTSGWKLLGRDRGKVVALEFLTELWFRAVSVRE